MSFPTLTDHARAAYGDEYRPEAGPGWPEHERSFLERLTFADADAILDMLRALTPHLVDGYLPVWVRNLAYRPIGYLATFADLKEEVAGPYRRETPGSPHAPPVRPAPALDVPLARRHPTGSPVHPPSPAPAPRPNHRHHPRRPGPRRHHTSSRARPAPSLSPRMRRERPRTAFPQVAGPLCPPVANVIGSDLAPEEGHLRRGPPSVRAVPDLAHILFALEGDAVTDVVDLAGLPLGSGRRLRRARR